MDALYSGQAGVMALLEGAEARVLRADDIDSEFTIGREGITYLFRGCSDTVVVKGARENNLRASFEEAWEADRALRLFLISLDPEEERDLRLEAADCLESLLAKKSTRTFIENEFYSRALPDDTDYAFFLGVQQWKLVSEMVAGILDKQENIRARRSEWDNLPTGLFENDDKTEFEELAIRHGAFRMLSSVDPHSEDRNLAILNCYQALAGIPNSRAVVTEWTADFKRPSFRPIIEKEELDEASEPKIVDGYAAFEHSKAQRAAIVEKLRQGSLNLARRYADQLVRFQLENGGVEYAAKSLCDLAQEAKYLHLYSVQLEWAQRAVDINPSDAWAHGQAADALIQFSRLDEALKELSFAEIFGEANFAYNGRARILRHQGKLEEALAAFRTSRQMFKGNPGEPHTWSGAAETLRDMWKFEEALREYQQGIIEFPNKSFLQCGKASVLADLGRLDEAVAAYDVPELRTDLVGLNGKASVLRDQGKFAEAQIVIAEAIERYPADPIARSVQAEIMRLQNDLEGALQLYQFLKLNHPTIPAAYGGYAEVLRDMRRLPEAISAYHDAASRFPDDIRIANGYANIRKVNDELAESLRIYEGNARRFPFDLFSKSGRADLLKRLGQYDDALAAYDEMLKVWPAYESARNGKAAILVTKALYSEALSLLPLGPPSTRNDWIAWHIRGMILLRRNEIDAAVRFFEEGSKSISFVREKRYFDGALSIAQIRQKNFQKAADALIDAGGALPNVLRFHARAGMGDLGGARLIYGELTKNCPLQLVDLRDSIAGRFDIIKDAAPPNDNWLFLRESEALLQEAA